MAARLLPRSVRSRRAFVIDYYFERWLGRCFHYLCLANATLYRTASTPPPARGDALRHAMMSFGYR